MAGLINIYLFGKLDKCFKIYTGLYGVEIQSSLIFFILEQLQKPERDKKILANIADALVKEKKRCIRISKSKTEDGKPARFRQQIRISDNMYNKLSKIDIIKENKSSAVKKNKSSAVKKNKSFTVPEIASEMVHMELVELFENSELKEYNKKEIQEGIQEKIQEKIQERIQEEIQEKIQERIQEEIQKGIQKKEKRLTFNFTKNEWDYIDNLLNESGMKQSELLQHIVITYILKGKLDLAGFKNHNKKTSDKQGTKTKNYKKIIKVRFNIRFWNLIEFISLQYSPFLRYAVSQENLLRYIILDYIHKNIM